MHFHTTRRTGLARVGGLLALLAGVVSACSDKADTTQAEPPSAAPGPADVVTPDEVTPPSAAVVPPPISGGTLIVLRDGKTAVASDPDRDQIYVVDLLTRKLVATINLQAQDEPGRLVEDADGRVHVALRRGGALLTLDPATGSVLARRPVCSAPRGLAFDATSGLVHVACSGGELVSMAPMGEAPVRSIVLDRDLRDVRVRGNELLVTTFRQAELIVVNAQGVEVTRHRSSTTPAAFGGSFKRESNASLTASPAVAWRMVAAPGGATMVLHQRGVDQPLGTQPGGYASPGCSGIVETAVSELVPDTVDAPARLQSGKALRGAILGVDMAVSPNGKQLAVVAAGNTGPAQLIFYDTKDATEGMAPIDQSLCVDGAEVPQPPEGETEGPLPVPIEYRPPNGQIIAVAFDPRGNIIVQSRQPADLQILTQRAAPIVLSRDLKADAGHQLFHRATLGMVACASCHPEGGDDSRIWQFSTIGKRRTQSLRGGIMDTAPFHWDGDMSNLNHLMTDVFQGRMLGTPLQGQQLTALAGWMDAIPRVGLGGFRADAVARGKAIFHSAQAKCASCHSGPDLTDGLSHDVGTGGRFQTPQLHGLALRAPYMHDGCAKTLQARFSGACGGDERHTPALDSTDEADLIAYLESL